MGNLAQRLGVVPMALYKHVTNKDELLNGMVDVVVGEIDPPGRRHLLEGGHPPAGAVGPERAPPPPVGVPGDRVACSATWTR
jgi:AcrR family transcriptional regulator